MTQALPQIFPFIVDACLSNKVNLMKEKYFPALPCHGKVFEMY